MHVNMAERHQQESTSRSDRESGVQRLGQPFALLGLVKLMLVDATPQNKMLVNAACMDQDGQSCVAVVLIVCVVSGVKIGSGCCVPWLCVSCYLVWLFKLKKGMEKKWHAGREKTCSPCVFPATCTTSVPLYCNPPFPGTRSWECPPHAPAPPRLCWSSAMTRGGRCPA